MQFMDEHRKFKFLSILFVLLPALLLISCVPMATDLRKAGFDDIRKGFASLDKTPNLHKVIELKNVRVHIVDDRNYFKWDKAAAYGSLVAGYATHDNEIYIFGKIVEGKIVLNQAILGHELTHLLNFENSKIADPDKLDDIGA